MKRVVLLIIFSLFLSACTIPFFGNNSSPQGKGLSVRIVTNPSISGKILSEGDSFTTNVEIINYFTSRKGVNGYICLRDQSGNTYGGIDDKQCTPINLEPAQNVDGNIIPTGTSIPFPSVGEFSYNNLGPTSIPNQINAEVYYDTETVTGGVACVNSRNSNKCSSEQNLQLSKSDAPLMVSKIIAATSYPSGSTGDASLNLELHISQNDDGEILSPGDLLTASSVSPEVRIDVTVENRNVNCRGAGFRGSTLEFSQLKFAGSTNEKVIKCKTTVNVPSDYVNVPVNIKLSYGFKKVIEGSSFTLKKSEESIA